MLLLPLQWIMCVRGELSLSLFDVRSRGVMENTQAAQRQTVREKAMLEEPHPHRNMPAGASNYNILSTNVWNVRCFNG